MPQSKTVRAFQDASLAIRVASTFAKEAQEEEALKSLPIATFLRNAKRFWDKISKAKDTVSKLKASFDKAIGYKGDKDRAKSIAEKVNATQQDAATSAQAVIDQAKKAVSVAHKHGVGGRDLSRVETQFAYLEASIKAARDSKPMGGTSDSLVELDQKVKNLEYLEMHADAIYGALGLLADL